jgi:hypothetical protein
MTLEEKRKKAREYCDAQSCCEECRCEGDWCESHLFEKCSEEELDELLKLISDNVDHPSHYQGKNECIDVMLAMFGVEAVKGFCKCNAYKYRFRAGQKEGNSAEQDIEKAEWYETYLMGLEKNNG